MRVPPLLASASVGDPSATRTVYISVIVLLVLGVALAALAVWLWRRTRPEPQLLAPLEEMDTRAWRKQDPAGQRRALDASRPPGARPVRREVAEPDMDTEFAEPRPVVSFDDLADAPASIPETADGEIADQADDADAGDADHGDEETVEFGADTADATGDLELDDEVLEFDDTPESATANGSVDTDIRNPTK